MWNDNQWAEWKQKVGVENKDFENTIASQTKVRLGEIENEVQTGGRWN